MTFACVPGFELRTTASATELLREHVRWHWHDVVSIVQLQQSYHCHVKHVKARARLAARTSFVAFKVKVTVRRARSSSEEEELGSVFGIMRYDEKEHEAGVGGRRGLRLSVESNISLEGNSLMDPLYGRLSCEVSEHRGRITKIPRVCFIPFGCHRCHPFLAFYSNTSIFSHSFFFF